MKSTATISLVLAATLATVAGCDAPQPPDPASTDAAMQSADLVFLDGGVYTVDPERPRAEAVAVRDGEIVYTGSSRGAHTLIGSNTRVIDLNGKLLLPGFHDAHVHLVTSSEILSACNLAELYTLDELLAKLETCRDLPGRGERGWITGGVWDREPFRDAPPDKALLDRYFPDRPAFLWASDGHSAWANTRALELAGIDRDTPNPPGGLIDREPETGEPTGLISEKATDLVERVIGPRSADDAIADILTAMRLAHSFGITSIIEPGVDSTDLGPLALLDKSERLKLRVLASVSPTGVIPGALDERVYETIETHEFWNGTHLRADSVKFFIDGVLETGTALLVDPYLDPEFDESHPPFFDQDVLNRYFQRIDAAGLQIHAHAIGDGAVRSALDAIAHARSVNGPNDNRHHIAHLQLIHPDDYGRFAELGVSANFQALWALPDYWIMELNLPVVGPERVGRMYPIASIERHGGRIVGGSDWSVSSMNPLDAIETAVRRQDPESSGGDVLNENERVDLATMLAAYTLNGAHLMRQEDRVGSITVGKRADLVVLDRDLFAVPDTEINETRVLLTVFDGEIVYDAAQADAGFQGEP